MVDMSVKVGMTLHCRVTKIDIERFQVELTSKTSDLVDEDNKWKCVLVVVVVVVVVVTLVIVVSATYEVSRPDVVEGD